MKRIIHPPIAIDDECGEKCPQFLFMPNTGTFPECAWAAVELVYTDDDEPVRCDKCIKQTKLEDEHGVR